MPIELRKFVEHDNFWILECLGVEAGLWTTLYFLPGSGLDERVAR